MSKQLSLFNGRSLNPIAHVKEAMRQAIKGTKISREQVVDRMNELARIEGMTTGGRAKAITTDLMDKWLSNSAEHLIPWKLLPIFCCVVECIDPIRPLVSLVDAHVISDREWEILEWAKLENKKRAINRKQRILEEKIINDR